VIAIWCPTLRASSKGRSCGQDLPMSPSAAPVPSLEPSSTMTTS
jgi:hypothetical protein